MPGAFAMNALILAAGYATRLYPLTLTTPKPLLPVAGRPVLDYLLDELRAIPGLRRVIVVTNHRFASHLAQWAASTQAAGDLVIEVLDDQTESNETRLGAIGDVAFATQTLPDLLGSPLFVLAGDNLTDFRLADLVADFHARHAGASVICLVREPDPVTLRRSGVVTIDATARVTGFVEKPADPPSDLTCPAFYVYSAAALRLVPEYLASGGSPDAPGNFIAWLHRVAPVYGHVFDEPRYDIGSVESYEAVCRLYEDRLTRRGETFAPAPSAPSAPKAGRGT
ncbi:MAG: nucleotidyltransferase family protein [Chloroflexi bacterium]|nr:nucleotidyltransferase family protein [Chloroflexota bacterium]